MINNSRGLSDLHIHSIFSDSDAEISGIFREARQKQLRCLAITDHDTIGGLASARACGRESGIEVINAIELSAQHDDIQVHVLGYFIDPANKSLLKELGHIKELRTQRLLWMAEKLASLGLNVDSEELFAGIGSTVPTRLHLAMYLVKKNIVRSLREAFKKYLSPGKPAYRSRFKHSVKEAVDIIKKAGGLSVLAHPHIIAQQSLIEEFIDYGLDGLEVVYPTMPSVKSSLYRDLAAKYNLVKTGGSDAHGTYKEYTCVGNVGIEYAWVEEMKGRL
jgi:3',5'-nucleoside bisphosphate phosphatase